MTLLVVVIVLALASISLNLFVDSASESDVTNSIKVSGPDSSTGTINDGSEIVDDKASGVVSLEIVEPPKEQ